MRLAVARRRPRTEKTIPAAPKLSDGQIRRFRKQVYDYYRHHGRDLPWRKATDPYRILISEVMLQQTQVARVIERYERFIRTFPDIRSLAGASLREVLAIWQGLGYNRRALALKKLAEIVVARHDGQFPADVETLKVLSGIGDATASAICTFAFNEPTVFIETNVRTVFIHHFFRGRTDVTDAEIRPLVAQTLDTGNPRIWYYALMDYGAALKRERGNPSRQSAHYQRQGPFEGSNRQVRGAILRALVRKSRITEEALISELPFPPEAVRENLTQLAREGFIVREEGEGLSIA